MQLRRDSRDRRVRPDRRIRRHDRGLDERNATSARFPSVLRLNFAGQQQASATARTRTRPAPSTATPTSRARASPPPATALRQAPLLQQPPRRRQRPRDSSRTSTTSTPDRPAAAVIKHTNPCGAAVGDTTRGRVRSRLRRRSAGRVRRHRRPQRAPWTVATAASKIAAGGRFLEVVLASVLRRRRRGPARGPLEELPPARRRRPRRPRARKACRFDPSPAASSPRNGTPTPSPPPTSARPRAPRSRRRDPRRAAGLAVGGGQAAQVQRHLHRDPRTPSRRRRGPDGPGGRLPARRRQGRRSQPNRRRGARHRRQRCVLPLPRRATRSSSTPASPA